MLRRLETGLRLASEDLRLDLRRAESPADLDLRKDWRLSLTSPSRLTRSVNLKQIISGHLHSNSDG